jgi:hypothetical protein
VEEMLAFLREELQKIGKVEKRIIDVTLDELKAKSGLAISKLSMPLDVCNLPLLPVLDGMMIDISHQMELVQSRDGKRGKSRLEPDELRYLVHKPVGCYWVIDVGISESESADDTILKGISEINQERKFCLTAEELISLCLVTESSDKAEIFAAGATYGSDALIPKMAQEYDGRPVLTYESLSKKSGRFLLPFCARRIG